MTKEIDRRSFLAGMLSLGAAGVVPKALGSAYTRPRSAPNIAEKKRASATGNKTLVLLTLYGGNDGLNTVVPLDDPTYAARRNVLAISPTKALPLGSGFGLNPAMPGLHAMWQAGQLAIVRGVGYPNPSLSHFQSMDIWWSGSLSNDVGSGWLGRWLDHTGHNALQACSIGPNVLPAMAGGKRKAAALQDSTYPGSQLPDANAHLLALYQELQRPNHFSSHLEASVAQSGSDMLTVSHTAAKAMVLEPAPGFSQSLSWASYPSSFERVCPPRRSRWHKAGMTLTRVSWRHRTTISDSSTRHLPNSWPRSFLRQGARRRRWSSTQSSGDALSRTGAEEPTTGPRATCWCWGRWCTVASMAIRRASPSSTRMAISFTPSTFGRFTRPCWRA